VITKDNVPIKVNAVVYFRVMDPNRSVVEVENYIMATSQLSQTTLRAVIGRADLAEVLRERTRSTWNSRRSSTKRRTPGESRSAPSKSRNWNFPRG